MARKKKEDPPAPGAPAWMASFADLMNLLLCFFVLLFAMSSVDAGKAEALIESLHSTFSIFEGGGSSFGDGNLISNGSNQLTMLEEYFNTMGQTDDGSIDQDINEGEGSGEDGKNTGGENSENNNGGATPDNNVGGATSDENVGGATPDDNVGGAPDDDSAGNVPSATPSPTMTPDEAVFAENKGQSETIYGEVMDMVNKVNLGDYVDIGIDSEQYHYITIEIKGHFLFDSGDAELMDDAKRIVNKIGDILKQYSGYKVEVIGHTDSVPQTKAPYYNNHILSTWRALSVATYLAETKNLGWENVYYEGRADLEKIASDDTEEGRRQNRRVEIRLYNKKNSGD